MKGYTFFAHLLAKLAVFDNAKAKPFAECRFIIQTYAVWGLNNAESTHR
jgi:hypothetical protein